MKFYFTHFFIFFCFLLRGGEALQSSGVHSHQDYVIFGMSRLVFDASCLVQGQGSQMTGVLVRSPWVVMTAAHGLVKEWKKASGDDMRDVSNQNIYAYFGVEGRHRYKVNKILIDPRFFKGEEGERSKYDLAYLQLEESVMGIKPVKLKKKVRLSRSDPLIGASYGSLGPEAWLSSIRRAFTLFEIDPIEYRLPEVTEFHTYLRRTLFSSIYFSPQERENPGFLKSEEEIRSWNAQRKWKEIGKPPYGLCLPGSSGGPVFMTLKDFEGKEEDFLFGLINSFTHLSNSSFNGLKENEAGFILRVPREQLYGHYQTVITSLYNQEIEVYHIDPHFYTFLVDPEVLANLERVSETPLPSRKKN